ncbi:YcjX family protein [Vibrio ruber]|uniref:YcjX family protein n=1 Tax=Vibrio ruber TaxID=184755 RepID=UPI002892BE62|nr:YcjX family protein [Vibrio ruber]WNJ95075.1 YcjX family protein [Vibrio ruber]
MRQIGQDVSELIQRGLDANIKIAVTGLSRAGKTAFITSLLNQIQYLSTHRHLPFLAASQQQRIIGTKRIPQRNLMVSRFDYEKAISAIQSQPPGWPAPTRDVSETRVAIKYRPEKRSKRLLGKSLTLHIDLIDYPGEWLLDLPLLEMSFEQWSAQQIQRLNGQRQPMAEPWLAKSQALDLNAEADEQRLADIATAYTDYLHDCKAAGFHWVQPGRFVLPGELAGAPVLQFFPCLPPDEYRSRRSLTTNYDVLKARYQEYQTKVVRNFYREYFATFDRQVVLVDCLSPLNAGQDSFIDMQQALVQLLQSFKYGRSGLLSRLFSPTIDKVLFAATKADHVTPDQHAHLLHLLNQMIQPVWQDVSYQNVAMECMTLASVQATQAGYITAPEGRIHAIQGTTLSGDSVTLFPGEVPEKLPSPAFWQSQRFDFTEFRPQISDPQQPLPHIRLDAVLEYLIGDKLR